MTPDSVHLGIGCISGFDVSGDFGELNLALSTDI